MCFRVAIIRITEHFVFQGAAGAAAASGPPGCRWVGLPLVGFGGFWWVLAGSGGFWWALRWVLELNNDTSKIIEIYCKKQCFGLRRLQDGAKMDPKNHFFGVLKSYEFIVKNRVWAG